MKNGKNERSKGINLRISQEEHDLLQQWVSRTSRKNASDLVRDILFHQPIQVTNTDQSAPDFLTVATGIKAELNKIGININQAVRRLHTFPYNSDLEAGIISLENEEKTLTDQTKRLIKKMQEFYVHLCNEIEGSKSEVIGPLLPGKN